MKNTTHLSRDEIDRVRALAGILLPGSETAPAATELEDFEQLVSQAVNALHGEIAGIRSAIAALPGTITRDSVSSFSESNPKAFELVSLVIVGAYFMAASVKSALGLPTGPRYAPSRLQIADELEDGLLDPVMERNSPIRTLAEVNSACT